MDLLGLRSHAVIAGLVVAAFATVGKAATIEERARLCAECHGQAGVPQKEMITPIIWGQTEGYLYLQLRDYKRGDRKDDVMTPLAEQFERDEMIALAEYFSKKPWPHNSQPPARETSAFKAAKASASVGCTGCHQEKYKGAGTQPRLAGQIMAYLAKTMIAFRNGSRANNPGMTTLMKAISEDEIAVLSEYLAGFELPPQ
jgi:cytochrome c553